MQNKDNNTNIKAFPSKIMYNVPGHIYIQCKTLYIILVPYKATNLVKCQALLKYLQLSSFPSKAKPS